MLVLGAGLLTGVAAVERPATGSGAPSRTTAPAGEAAAIVVDYPRRARSSRPTSRRPPSSGATRSAATSWRVEVTFADGAAPVRAQTLGPRMRVGEIDPRAVGPTNELPTLTPEQAAARTWKPDAATWEAIKERSVEAAATVTITGFAAAGAGTPVSRGQVAIRTSRDPVGAPIFYRDVPLMPSAGEKGVIKPLATARCR